MVKNYYYIYPGYNLINFYADAVGQHILLFAIDYSISNAVAINVAAYNPPAYPQPGYPQPLTSYPQSSNQQSTYQQSNYQTSNGGGY